MSTAFVFAGQGAQYPGMGRDLYEHYEVCRKVFEQAGAQITDLCFNGTEEELKVTAHTQPCIYTVTMAAYRALVSEYENAAGCAPEPAAMAGFSLGEYAALTAAGVIPSIRDGAELMKYRGMWMHEAGTDEEGTSLGGMIAAMGRFEKIGEAVRDARGSGILTAANRNAPLQTVVSGDLEALNRFEEAAAERRIRTVRLAVESAFHSEMMLPASEKMRGLVLNKELGAAAVPVYSNLTGAPVSEYRRKGSTGLQTKEDLADLLARQLMSPVQWVDTMKAMKELGVDTVVEFGPGTTLSGLAVKNIKGVTVCHVEDSSSLREAIECLLKEKNTGQNTRTQ